ncbi:hypothetical protein [Salinarimonas soli]|uniref:Uncharacterized protein n=1 Tax=Salinarimonas soli TaxID=1638099 RepID=A0A5B2V9I7_9HYPH|nr:hypothetical protein [Salinarimonas soli]KAA2235255.1 hypothetical protein F0L46_21165 [Salinarimonas soli]
MKYQQPFGAAANAPYVNGNPATGTAGSIPPAASIEHPQRELDHLIAYAVANAAARAALSNGIALGAPSEADLQQVRKALQAMFLEKVVGATTDKAPKLIGFRGAFQGQGYATSVNTQMQFSVLQNNLSGTSNFSSNQLTVGAGEGGIWLLGGFIQFVSGSAGLAFTSVSARVNGTQQLIGGANPGSQLSSYANFCEPFLLPPGDVVTWFGFQQSGSTTPANNQTASAYLVSAA